MYLCFIRMINSFDDVSNKDNILSGPEGTQHDFIIVKSRWFQQKLQLVIICAFMY